MNLYHVAVNGSRYSLWKSVACEVHLSSVVFAMVVLHEYSHILFGWSLLHYTSVCYSYPLKIFAFDKLIKFFLTAYLINIFVAVVGAICHGTMEKASYE